MYVLVAHQSAPCDCFDNALTPPFKSMSYLRYLSTILLTLTMFYGWASPSVATSQFVCRGVGLTEPERSSLWNLSDVSTLDKAGLNLAPRYVATSVHDGESVRTIISEIIDGRRMRYLVDGSNLIWIGEETPEMHIRVDTLCYTSALLPFGDCAASLNLSGAHSRGKNIRDYSAHGRYCNNMYIVEKGIYCTTRPQPGIIVLGPDSLDALLTIESRRYTADISGDVFSSLPDAVRDSLEIYTVTRYRWYVSDNYSMPIAVQTNTSSRSAIDGSEIDAASSLYTLASDDIKALARPKDNFRDIESVINNARAYYAAGSLHIILNSRMDLAIAIGVSSLDGIPYYSKTIHINGIDEEQDIVLTDLPSLPSGRYMVGINCSDTPAVVNRLYIVVP